jgi:hypothetical protein
MLVLNLFLLEINLNYKAEEMLAHYNC